MIFVTLLYFEECLHYLVDSKTFGTHFTLSVLEISFGLFDIIALAGVGIVELKLFSRYELVGRILRVFL